MFRGISKPILGLAWAATGDSPRHPHRRAFPRPPPHPFSSLLPSSVPLATPDNLHSRAPPCRPTPLSSGPPRKRKACGFSSRVGVGLFPSSPVTSSAPPDWPMPRQWRHIGLAHWPTRFIDISTVHPLSSPQKWVTRTGVARTGPFSLKLSLYFSLFLSPSLSFSPSLSLFFSPVLSVSFCFALFPALSLFVWKHGASEGYLVKYPQRCSHIKNRVRQKNSLCICREETDFHYTDVNDHLASFIVNRSQQFRLFLFYYFSSYCCSLNNAP